MKSLGDVLEALGGVLGALEGVLETSWNRFWASWALLEASWALLEVSLRRFEAFGGRPRRFWERLGSAWMPPGKLLKAFLGVSGVLGGVLGTTERLSGASWIDVDWI